MKNPYRKTARHFKRLSLVVLVLGIASASSTWAVDEEALGRAAEDAGQLQGALKHYIAALQGTGSYGPEDYRLREKIIAIALKLVPKPTVPEEAKRYLIYGKTAVTEAAGKSELQYAVEHFEKALRIAPWWAEAYFNLGFVQDKIGAYEAAGKNFKLYLLAMPQAADGEAVRAKIYELEYRQQAAARRGTQPTPSPPEVRQLSGSIAGTTWSGVDTAKTTMQVVFESENRVRLSLSKQWLTGTWRQDGADVYFEVNDGNVEYRGRIFGSSMNGSARNRQGFAWRWKVERD